MDELNIELRQKFSDIADAIRQKSGKSEDIPISAMSDEIYAIPGDYARYYVDENGNALTRTKPLNLDQVKSISDYGMNRCFYNCSNLPLVSLPQLTSIGSRGFLFCFSNCSKLSSISFPQLTSIGSRGFLYCFSNCSKLTAIHFRSDTQSVVEAQADYASKFGATNATIYFDL